MKFPIFFPRILLVIFALFLLFLTYFRIQFWALNHRFFESDVYDFLLGLRFDLSLLGYLFLVLTPVYFICSYSLGSPKAIRITKSVSTLLFVLIAFTECWDLAYFQYTLKRCSFDLYLFYLGGKDRSQGVAWLITFWYLIGLFVLLNALFALGLRRFIPNRAIPETTLGASLYMFLFCMALSFGLARNSWEIKPLGILDANREQVKQNPALVLNSLFVVLKTMQNSGLPSRSYLTDKEEARWFNPKWHFSPGKDETTTKPNLVFLLIESLGIQQLGQTEKGIPLTPFLDSLYSVHGKNVQGYAEGKTSIEVLPALFAGIPSWQDQPYVLSDYAMNQWVGFPRLCKNLGYQTSFFHGAHEASMRFGAVQRSLGFEKAYFEEDLPTVSTDRGSWGFHDKPVLEFMLKQLSLAKKPFMATFFSLSSHEPYDIPASFLQEFPMLTKEQAAYRYVDCALRSFFQNASNESWFTNTLFIITADHTPVHLDQKANSIQDYYKVPLIMFYPNQGPLFDAPRTIGHSDIVPILCSRLHWKVSLYGFGSPFEQDQIRYINGLYHLWNRRYTLCFDEKKQQWLTPIYHANNHLPSGNSSLEKSIHQSKLVFFAKLQRFRKDLRNNTCRP